MGALRGEILQYVSGDVGCVGWLVESAFVKIGLTGSDMAKGEGEGEGMNAARQGVA